MDYPKVDYASHPGFASCGAASKLSIASQITELEDLLSPIRTGIASVPKGTERRRLQAKIDKILLSVHTEAVTGMNDRSLPTQSLARGLNLSRPEFLGEAEFSHRSSCTKESLRQACKREGALQVADSIARDGGFQSRVPEYLRDEVHELLTPYREQAMRIRDRDPGGRSKVELPKRGRLWECIKEVYERGALAEGLCLYSGQAVEPYNCVLEYSHEDQTWWKEGYADVGLTTSSSVGFHNDHSFDRPKAIQYVGDEVDKRNGAFQFVKGSHHWRRPVSETLLIKGMDQAHQSLLAARETVYYRPHFQNIQFRRLWMQLPVELRQTSHFGDDVVDGTLLQRVIDEQTQVCSSDRGDVTVFDGNTVLHRGGLVTQGERWALQVVFQPVEHLTRRYQRLIANKLQTRTQLFRMRHGK